MWYSFSDTSFHSFQSIENRSPYERRNLAETLLEDAITYNRICNEFQSRISWQLVLSNFVMLVVVILQILDLIPGWIPGWYVAMLCYDDAWNRLPELTAWTQDRMREANADPATEDDFKWSNLHLVLMFVIWGVGGWYTGNWIAFSIGTTICSFFLYIVALKDFNKVVRKNRKAYEVFVQAVMRLVKEDEIAFRSEY